MVTWAGQQSKASRTRRNPTEARSVILVDTGPLVALFDPADSWHTRCVAKLETLKEPLCATVPVLAEAFHLLTPDSTGSKRLMEFIVDGGMRIWFLDDEALTRTFELITRYANVPMDLADASLVVAAERLNSRRVFTIDRRDFAIYRIRKGHRHMPFELIA